jgi:NAD(P) transhydrogenase subunit alpha
MKCYVLAEDKEFERRVSLTPEVLKKLISLGHEVFVEKGAGDGADFGDIEYSKAGAVVISERDFSKADVIFSINPLSEKDINLLKKGTFSIAPQYHYQRCDNVTLFLEKDITSFALDFIPRTTRAQYMDILSSQASLAGYKAVIEAAHILNRALPLMLTTAGTIPAAKLLIIGAGVAGLQAIATAKRLGAVVSAFDVRTSAKEQVESLGAKFIEVDSDEKFDGVYAKEMSEEYRRAQEDKLRSVLPQQDIIITTAQIPGKKAPIIIKADMIDSMKKGSLIIDLASKTGGNCELTLSDQTVEKFGVKITAFDNILNLIPHDASRFFAKNVLSFFELLMQKMTEVQDISMIDDDIIKATLLTHRGKLYKDIIT